MLRPLVEAGEEIDGQQIEKAFNDPCDAVLRVAELAGAVVDDDLAHLPAAGGGQHGHEAMQLAVEAHFVEDFAAVALEAAVVVVQLHAGQPADEPVEDARRADLVPRIVADLLPAADAVEAAVDLGQEAGDFARIVLQVGIERDDQFARGRVKTGRESRRLAEIAAEANAAHARIGRRQPLDLGPRAVRRAVVDEDDLQIVTVLLATSANSPCKAARLSSSLKTGMTAESMGSR